MSLRSKKIVIFADPRFTNENDFFKGFSQYIEQKHCPWRLFSPIGLIGEYVASLSHWQGDGIPYRERISSQQVRG